MVERRKYFALILLALSLATYLGTAVGPALFDDVDGAHALAAREILSRGDWTVLHINGIRYLEKPPFHYWLVAASYAFLGESDFATRLPLVLAVTGLVLMVFAFGCQFFDEHTGFYAGLVICTSLGTFLFTRTMIPEAILALEFTAIFYLFLRAWTGSLSPRFAYWSCAALIGLAVMTRGLIGFIFPVAVLGLFLLFNGGWRRWRELPLVSGALIFLVIAGPWHLLAGLRNPGFFWFYFINEHFLRAIGARYPQDSIYMPLLLWYAAHLLWLFPWSFFVPYALRELPAPRTWRKELDPGTQARVLLLAWAGFILLFFTISERAEYYSFGAWPAMALLLGLGVARAEQTQAPGLRRLQAALAVLGVLVALVLGAWLLVPRSVRTEGDLSALLLLGERWFTLEAAGTFFRLTQSIRGLRLPATAAMILLIFGLGGAWVLRNRSSRRGTPGVHAALFTALAMAGFFFAANLSLKVFEPYMSSRSLARAVGAYLGSDERIVIYGDFYLGSTFGYYVGRQALIYNGRKNSLEFGSYYPDAPRIFLTDNDFPALWNGPHRAFLFVPQQLRREALVRLPRDSSYLLAESGGKVVYVNRALAPGQLPLAQIPTSLE